MGFRDVLRVGMEEYYEGLRKVLGGLTAEERRFQPAPDANHIDFIVWHMARAEDNIFHLAFGVDEVWVAAGWFREFRLAAADDGCGFTAEQVRTMPAFEMTACMRYFAEVRESALTLLAGVGDDLGRCPPAMEARGLTRGQLLGHLLVENGQHLGQVAYIRGLRRGIEHSTSWNNPETPTPG